MSTPRFGEKVKQMELTHFSWECKFVQHFEKFSWQYLLKPNMHIPCEPAVSLLSMTPTDTSAYNHQKIHRVRMLIAALFVIAPTW